MKLSIFNLWGFYIPGDLGKSMSIIERNPILQLYCSNLNILPGHELPAPFSIQYFQPGDEALWLNIWQAVEKFLDIIRRNYWIELQPLLKAPVIFDSSWNVVN